MAEVIPQPPKAALPHKMPPMVKAMWAVCIVLAVATVAVLVVPRGGASDGAWGKLTTGTSAAGAPTLLPNPDFEKEGAMGWAHHGEMLVPPGEIHEGAVDKSGGRTGGALVDFP